MNKGELIITKELFCEIFNKMIEQYDLDSKCNEAFSVILPGDYISGYDNAKLYKSLIRLLQKAFGDGHKHSCIDYFVYELEFGRKYKSGCYAINKKNIKLSTPEDLYNLLTKYNHEAN